MARLTDAQVAALVLERAAVRISPPGRWCQGCMARDAAHPGRPVGPCSADARSWSMLGAVHRELWERKLSGGREDRVYGLLVRTLADACGFTPVRPAQWTVSMACHAVRAHNDETSKGGALRALDAARMAIVRQEA